MTTQIPYGDPGIASFVSEEFGAIELLSGDAPLFTTNETVGASLTLSRLAVVGRNAAGTLVMATYGGAGVRAQGALTFTAAGSDAETVTIGTTVYTLKTTPAAAYDVQIGGSAAATAANLIAAINASGLTGAYFTGTVAHPDVTASSGGGAVIEVLAKVPGQAGEAIATTETSAVASFAAATLTGGVGAGARAMGILTAAVSTGVGESMTVDVFRGGMFNPGALVWDASFDTDAKKKAAFEGGVSPNIFIQKNPNDPAFT